MIFRDGPVRFFFFSREQKRLHIHVQSPDGEAKLWVEPEIELARSYRQSISTGRREVIRVGDCFHRNAGMASTIGLATTDSRAGTDQPVFESGCFMRAARKANWSQ